MGIVPIFFLLNSMTQPPLTTSMGRSFEEHSSVGDVDVVV